jgi:hypothetical protein
MQIFLTHVSQVCIMKFHLKCIKVNTLSNQKYYNYDSNQIFSYSELSLMRIILALSSYIRRKLKKKIQR